MVKEESEKVGLKLNIQNMKIMTSCPITSWQIGGEKVETVADFIFLGSKITVDSDCTHGIKRRLLLWRKAMTKLRQCIKKQRYHFANKGLYSQSYGISSSHVWMWIWTIRKTEHQRISSIQSLSHVRLFATPWITVCQTSLSITNFPSPRKLMSIESVIPSRHLILCRPLLLPLPIPPSIRVFS